MASYHHNTMKLNDMKTVKKCFIIQSGKTPNCDKQVMKILYEHVPELKLADKVEECDFILAFCTVASRAGTDIERALQKLHSNSDSKPAVVVVLHHTFDSDYVAPNSSRSVKREKTITVDVLFHEDLGLLQCTKNNESLVKVINHLKPQLQKEKHLPSPQDSHSVLFPVIRKWWNTFTSSYKNTENNDKSKDKGGTLEDQELLQTELKLVLMGKSNSSKIMDTIKREINAHTDKFSQQSKMIIVEVIVVDMLDSGFSPDHVSQSSGALQHYYLLVVPVDEPTEGKKRMLDEIEKIFGRECWRNTVIIFTGTKEGQSENQDIMTQVEECGISFLCLNVHENINSSQVSVLLKKVEMKVDENQDSEIHKVIESQIRTIKKNIKDKESKHEKLKTDILNFVTSIEEAINNHENEVNRISDILESEIEEMNNEVTVEGFKRSLQLRVNKTVREMKQKVRSLAVALNRAKSKIDKNCGVNEGGAGVDDPINLVSNLEKNIIYLKSKMQKYMKQNRTHVSMLEKKDRELQECRPRITEMEKRNTELEKKNTELEKKNTELEKKNTELEKGNTELEKKNTELEKGNTELEKRNTELEKKNTELEKKNTELEKKNTELEKKNTELEKNNTELEKKNTELEKRNTELEERNPVLDKRNPVLRWRNTKLEERNTVLGWRNTEFEKKNTELGWRNTEFEKKNTELGWRNTEFEKKNTEFVWRNTEFEEGNTVLRELEQVRKVEGSKTRETGKRPGGEGQGGKEQMMKNGQEYGQELEKDIEIKKTGRSDGGLGKSEEHKKREEGQGGDGEGQKKGGTPVME